MIKKKDAKTSDGRDIVTVCMYCRRIRVGGRWVTGTPDRRYCAESHGVCQDCEHKVMTLVGR
jgi:hypothetical protein